jgi:single-strand DNA-binding protein
MRTGNPVFVLLKLKIACPSGAAPADACWTLRGPDTLSRFIFFPPIFMKSVNSVTLLGHVTRDAEFRTTAAGKSVSTFGLATNRVWKDANGQRHSLAEFHHLVCWGPLAEFAALHVCTGKPLYVEGSLKTRQWESADGAKHWRTEVTVRNLVLLGARPAEDAEQEEEAVPEETDEEAIEESPMA